MLTTRGMEQKRGFLKGDEGLLFREMVRNFIKVL